MLFIPAVLGCLLVIASIYIWKTNSSHDPSYIIHICVDEYGSGLYNPNECDFSNEMVMLRVFNEDILDQIFLDDRVSNLRLKIKQGIATYKEYVLCYTDALYEAINKLKQKVSFESKLEGGDIYSLMNKELEKKQENIYGLVWHMFRATSSVQNVDKDIKFKMQMKELLSTAYFNILKSSKGFSYAIYNNKCKDTLSQLSECRALSCIEYLKNDKKTCFEHLTLSRLVFIIETEKRISTERMHKGQFHFYIDLTTIILICVSKYTIAGKTDYVAMGRFEYELIEHTSLTAKQLILRLKQFDIKRKYKFTIILDQLQLVEYAIRLLKEKVDVVKIFLKNIGQIIPEICSEMSKTTEDMEKQPIEMEFLDCKELFRSKVNSHKVVGEIAKKLALPTFVYIKKDLHRIFGISESNSTAKPGELSLINHLIDTIYGDSINKYDKNPKYKEAIEIIGEGCASCKCLVERCIDCKDFMKGIEYIYTQIVSYCLTLEHALPKKHFENLDELLKHYEQVLGNHAAEINTGKQKSTSFDANNNKA